MHKYVLFVLGVPNIVKLIIQINKNYSFLSFFSIYPVLPQTQRSLWLAMKHPGPAFWENGFFLIIFPSLISYSFHICIGIFLLGFFFAILFLILINYFYYFFSSCLASFWASLGCSPFFAAPLSSLGFGSIDFITSSFSYA